jgi:hypothetical protein
MKPAVSWHGGGGGSGVGEGGGGDAATLCRRLFKGGGGETKAAAVRIPQSVQSVPAGQRLYSEPAPPSSHEPSLAHEPPPARQLSEHASKQEPSS